MKDRSRTLQGNLVGTCLVLRHMNETMLDLERVKDTVPPRARPDPSPYPVISMIPHDKDGNFPLMFRGPNVRSAPNCWSIPSGLREHGLSKEEQIIVELDEELSLVGVPGTYIEVGSYDNVPGDGWHWDIHVGVIKVETLSTLTNKEPDKHPEIRTVNIKDLRQIAEEYDFHPTLKAFLKEKWLALQSAALHNIAQG